MFGEAPIAGLETLDIGAYSPTVASDGVASFNSIRPSY